MWARSALHNPADSSKFSTMIPALLLIFSVVIYRIATGFFGHPESIGMLNFAPLGAIALCAAAYFPPKFKFAVPMLALLVSDIALNLHYGYPLLSPAVLSHYLGFAVVGVLGVLLSGRASWRTLLPASLAASFLFFAVTNTVSWIFDPGYVKNAAGWVQALTVGLPAYSATPTWMFFRNSLVSDLLFTGLFVACMHFGRAPQTARAEAAIARPA